MKKNNQPLLYELFSSQARSEIFRLFFGFAPRPLHLREIQRRSGLCVSPIQQELRKLTRLQLLLRREDGNRVYYEANRQHPLYPEFHRIVLKTSALTELISAALKDDNIRYAFIFGSLARNEETATSDIDLMVIGDIGLRRIVTLLASLPDILGREINPHALTMKELAKRVREKDPFVTRILNSEKIFIKGDHNELECLAQ